MLCPIHSDKQKALNPNPHRKQVIMPDKCYVPGCKTGYDSNPETNIGRFHPPKGKLEEWNQAIPRALVSLKYKDVVCEKHFSPEEVSSKFEIKLPDGSVIEEPRKKKLLVEGAIPHIFPNLPKYLTSKNIKRKSPKKRYSSDKEHRTAPESILVEKLKNPLVARWNSFSALVMDSFLNFQRDKMLLQLKSLPTPLQEAWHDVTQISVPNNWKILQDNDNVTFIHSPAGNVFKVDRSVSLPRHLPEPPHHPKVLFNGKDIQCEETVRTKENLEKFLRDIHNLKACPGTGIQGNRHSLCCQVVFHKQINSNVTVRCKFCQRYRKIQLAAMRRQQQTRISKAHKTRARHDKKYRMKKKIESLKDIIKRSQDKMKAMDDDAIKKVLEKISEAKHREVVQAIIMASKFKRTNSRRYSNEYMYECILMRIKGPALYRKMLNDNLLPLPSFRTIQRFIKRLRPQFGFHETTFKLMEQKAKYMSEDERHGTLMLDEMTTSENIQFNKETGQVQGMVDLGSASPPNADSTLGDHGLVFMFQPFKGKSFQAIGAFCSRGAANGQELQKLVTEAILLLYKHGYYVDIVTTDGGSWNRNMWTQMGITKDKVSCLNPSAAGEGEEGVQQTQESAKTNKSPRRLWFLSDFPHLVKSMWSRVRNSKVLETPDGTVKLKHWETLADEDDERFTHINICHKLTHDHVQPSEWQTMNVQMAFQFFHDDVADAMEHYRDKEHVKELADCHATVAFIRRINRLRKAMNANHKHDSLRNDPNSEAHQAITDFLKFLEQWKHEVPNKNMRLAWQTELGLQVTLKATLELCAYLTTELGFDYVMTRRLNQDPLEHFFGMIRQACGANNHPDPIQFILVYRLLATASLIKPPRGSNVTGGEMLNALTSITEVLEDPNLERRVKLEEEIDRILDHGDEEAVLERHLLSLSEDNYIETTEPLENDDHCYNSNRKINPYGFQVFGGYVARKVRKFSTAKNCSACFESLCRPDNAKEVETQYLIEKKSRGFLLKPSTKLYNFLYKVEDVILQVLGRTKMNRHILLEVVDELHRTNISSEVGCDIHKRELTKQALTWYLNTRMFFACKRHIKTQTVIKNRQRKAKSLSKKIKLNAIPVAEAEILEENIDDPGQATEEFFTEGFKSQLGADDGPSHQHRPASSAVRSSKGCAQKKTQTKARNAKSNMQPKAKAMSKAQKE